MLVIFDCDGVLVESETLAARVFSEQLALLGVILSPPECEALFVGKTMQNCLEYLRHSYPDKIPADFLAQVDSVAEAVFDREMEAIPGVEAVLVWLQQQGIPRCVGSNGSVHKVTNSLRRTGLTDFFEGRVYSADLVALPKPAPDLYLFAAETMGVAPEFTWVIEDSEVGMTAAIAAGMKVVLYRPPWRAVHFMPPEGVIELNDMAGLPQLLSASLGIS